MSGADRTALKLIEGGTRALRDGRFALAVKQLAAGVARVPESLGAWVFYGQALCRDGQSDDWYTRVLPAAAVAGHDPALLLHHVITALAAADRDRLEDLTAWAEAQTPCGLLLLFYRGALRLKAGRVDAGFADLLTFRARLEGVPDLLPVATDEGCNTVFRHAINMEPPAVVDRLMSDAPYHPPPLEWVHGDATGPGPVVQVACDGRYAARYLAGYVAAFARWRGAAILHVHLADADATALAQVAALRAQCPFNLSVERSVGVASGAYYASMRFLRAGQMLDRYRRPVFVTDVDVAFRRSPGDLAGALDGADIACFRLEEKLLPASLFPAVLCGFADNEAARRLLAATAAVIAAKLNWPPPLLWLLDQAALASALYALDGQVVRADIAQRTGADMYGWFDLDINTEAKGAMIAAANASSPP